MRTRSAGKWLVRQCKHFLIIVQIDGITSVPLYHCIAIRAIEDKEKRAVTQIWERPLIVENHVFKLNYTLSNHGIRYLEETGDIRSGYEVAFTAILFSSFYTAGVDVLHDVMQLGVYFFK